MSRASIKKTTKDEGTVDVFGDLGRDTVDVFGDTSARQTMEDLQYQTYHGTITKQEIKKTMGEDLRLDKSDRARQTEEPGSKQKTPKAQMVSSRHINDSKNVSMRSRTSNKYSAERSRDGLSQSRENMFGKKRMGSQRGSNRGSSHEYTPIQSEKQRVYEKIELKFEKDCFKLIQERDWEKLEVISVEQLDACKGKSSKGFFYLGVALYKMDCCDQAIKAYQKSNELFPSDPQLHYNIGLAYFKDEQYTLAVEHLKLCTQMDPTNVFAYNNLAFIYNMHQYYQETINVCNTAKMQIDKQIRAKRNAEQKSLGGNSSNGESLSVRSGDDEINHTCHRHWAFALFKKGEMAKAIKKIKKAIQLDPKDADNWIVWGLIMRTVGNYKSSVHKFNEALKLDPGNETAKQELQLLDKIMDLDSQITLDQVAIYKKMRPNIEGEDEPEPQVTPGEFKENEQKPDKNCGNCQGTSCSMDHAVCNIF